MVSMWDIMGRLHCTDNTRFSYNSLVLSEVARARSRLTSYSIHCVDVYAKYTHSMCYFLDSNTHSDLVSCVGWADSSELYSVG